MLTRLYEEQTSSEPYLVEHASPAFVEAQVRTFGWYAPHLPEAGKVLDWGANHGPDSCLLRSAFGDRFELHACDFGDIDRFPVFRRAAHAHYRQLTHHIDLPYPDATFNAIIGSGVLEHTAMDDESLKELYRIMAPGGRLVISYLPNRLSWEEWRRRCIEKRDYHLRLYGLGEASEMLKHRGFRPVTARHQSFFWERALPNHPGLRSWLRRAAPFHLIGPTLFLVAEKVSGF